MAYGLDIEQALGLKWRWLPVPAWPLDRGLPPIMIDDPVVSGEPRPAFDEAGAPTCDEGRVFRFSFPQLSVETPDLRFYRLIQIFNTPLLSVTTRDAGRTAYALWHGKQHATREDGRFAHLWFFKDETDGDDVVLEYGFNGAFRAYSRVKSPVELTARYRTIASRLN